MEKPFYKLNKEMLQNHLAYHGWIYIVILFASCFVWQLIFTITTPRIAQNKQIEFYCLQSPSCEESLQSYLADLHQSDFSDMESLSSVLLMVDEIYGNVQITTYITAHQGDVYMLPTDLFYGYAASGVFEPLENETDLIQAAEAAGCLMEKGWQSVQDSSERHLLGIPAEKMPGLKKLGMNVDDMWFCVLKDCGNKENAVRFVRLLLRDFAQ